MENVKNKEGKSCWHREVVGNQTGLTRIHIGTRKFQNKNIKRKTVKLKLKTHAQIH